MKTLRTALFVFMFVLSIIPIAHASEADDLLGVSLDFEKKEITISVATSGCTQKGDFLFEMKDDVLYIIRTNRDSCKAMQSKSRFTYSLKEAGISPNKPFKIANRFIANIYLANIR